MTVYTTVARVEAFLAAGDYQTATLSGTAAEKEALVLAAEDDVDRVLAFTVVRDPTTGRKLIPAALTVAQAAALERAVCLQAVWRWEVGDEALAGLEDDVQSVAGIALSTQTRPPCPGAVEALSGHGLPWRSGTVAPAPE